MTEPSRAEHVRWCKKRAREYLAIGDAQQAVTSMLSDMSKHPETKGTASAMEAIAMFSMQSLHEATKFVEGFNE